MTNSRNTPDEIQRQEEALRNALIDELRQRSLIVSGYSGRDQSIIEALHAAYDAGGAGTLYWCGYGEGDVPEAIRTLIDHARVNGQHAYYIPSLGFDDLMTRLSLHCLDGAQHEAVRKDISELDSDDLLERQPFQIPECRAHTFIKSNAFEVDCPTEVFTFDLETWPTEKVWSWLREQIGTRSIVAVPFKRKIFALGTVDDIKDIFGDNLKGPIERTPISPNELRFEDGAIVSLMREALVRALSESADVLTNGRSELWLKQQQQKIKQGDLLCYVHESVVVFLRYVGGIQYVVLKPSIKVFNEHGEPVVSEIAGPVKLRILGYQHNKHFNTAMNKWRKLLFRKKGSLNLEFPGGVGSTFKFSVRPVPTFAKIGLSKNGRTTAIPQKIRPLLKHRGLQLQEPLLVFCSRDGTRTSTDTQPRPRHSHQSPV